MNFLLPLAFDYCVFCLSTLLFFWSFYLSSVLSLLPYLTTSLLLCLSLFCYLSCLILPPSVSPLLTLLLCYCLLSLSLCFAATASNVSIYLCLFYLGICLLFFYLCLCCSVTGSLPVDFCLLSFYLCLCSCLLSRFLSLSLVPVSLSPSQLLDLQIYLTQSDEAQKQRECSIPTRSIGSPSPT